MEIKIEHLNKNYGKQCALKDISLHIPVGMYGLFRRKRSWENNLYANISYIIGTVNGNGRNQWN